MKNTDIYNIWNKQGYGLDSDLILKPENLGNIEKRKVRESIRKLFYRRITETSVFVLLIIILIRFIIKNPGTEYIISGLALIFFAVIGVVGSIGQVITILRLDYSEPVTTFQIKIERLRLYSLRTLQILFMSLPFYMSYIIIGYKSILGLDILENASNGWLISNCILTILAVPFSVYLFGRLNLKTKNNWLKRLIAENGGRQIDEAIRFIDEIEMLKGKNPAE